MARGREDISGRLLRLPFFYEITEEEQRSVADHLIDYCRSESPGQRRPKLVVGQ